jgi:glycosyltransferase involved in cell wall biosynthesis
MRIGFNPNKDKINSASSFFHQVIIPVYIPNFEGYFKDSLQILQFCLESLFKTSHSNTFFSIVNNGSNEEVRNYLDGLLKKRKIHEVIHTHNIGKLNAILKGISGQQFEIITITDADVLFLNNWQSETYAVFNAFPKAGAICPTPSSKMAKHYTYNILFENFFSKKLQFTPVKNGAAMINFAKSIGNLEFYQECHLTCNLTISNKNTKAVLGAGHFVTTYRGEIFNKLKERCSNFGLGGNSEEKFLDMPVADQGYWRLSTEDNFAFHMGNVSESWMQEKLDNLEDHSKSIVVQPPMAKKIYVSRFSIFIKSRIFMKILTRKRIWKLFLQFKGLNKEFSKKY